MVQVRISETYDLSTKVNKMGIVGIHTPTGGLIDKLWSGLVLQYRKFRFVKCDVAMACASMLPADPLQIGVEAGAIAPQDMFNPILYKAVSNDSMNNFLGFIRNADSLADFQGAFSKGSVVDVNNADFAFADGATTNADQFMMYYGLLADASGWKKAMPQAGLTMRNLYPLVYNVVSQYGQYQMDNAAGTDPGSMSIPGPNSVGSIEGAAADHPVSTDGDVQTITTAYFRGRSMRMPAINTMVYAPKANVDIDIVPGQTPNYRAFLRSNTGDVPPAYVGLIVLPPAKLNQLYYRLKVTWTIEFSDLKSMLDIGSWASVLYAGQDAYGTDYADQVASMSATTAMVDTSGATIEKIMEGS
uniref:Capsid protein n=1 Tax=Chrysolophus pictus Smacoviridae sp. TaxID=2814972 RepID=A0A8A4XCZ4_9VIRU